MQGDNGTYKIFLHSGIDDALPVKDEALISSEVWALSLPSFIWFRANSSPPGSASSCTGYTYTAAPKGRRQMIVISSLNRSAEPYSVNATDA
jgi:hypothetical protein